MIETGNLQHINANRVIFLDWLRAIACLMVLIVHASECIYSNDYSFSFPSEAGRWSVCLINGFVRPAVPLFLIASAYLLVPLKLILKLFSVNALYGLSFLLLYGLLCMPFFLYYGKNIL